MPRTPIRRRSFAWSRRRTIGGSSGLRGRVSIHIGGIDSQSPGDGEYAFAQARIKAGIFVRAPRLVFHEGRGHSLRTGEPAMGPMDDAAKSCLLKEIEEMLAVR